MDSAGWMRTVLPVILLFLSTIVVFLGMSGAALAQTYQSPHGNFSASSQLCSVCHEMHEATGNKLLKHMPESALCFTCHNGTGSIYNTEVQMDQDPATYAMHPINVALPNNPGSYSVTYNTTAGIAPLAPYDCSDCHNPHIDTGHGLLLRGSYDTSEYVTYVAEPDPYTACWSCHNPTAVVQDTTFFPNHQSHINTHQASCTTCHYSPHGVTHIEMVSFNPVYVGPSAAQASGPAFVDNGQNSGSCTLTCHGVDHGPANY